MAAHQQVRARRRVWYLETPQSPARTATRNHGEQTDLDRRAVGKPTPFSATGSLSRDAATRASGGERSLRLGGGRPRDRRARARGRSIRAEEILCDLA